MNASMILSSLLGWTSLFGTMDRDIDNFFKAHNQSSEDEVHQPLLSVHYLGEKCDSVPSPLISSEKVEVESLLKDKTDYVKGGLHAAGGVKDYSGDVKKAIGNGVIELAVKIADGGNPLDAGMGAVKDIVAEGVEKGKEVGMGIVKDVLPEFIESVLGDPPMKESLMSIPKGDVYSFLVGIETVSPLLSSAIKQVQSWANQINGTHIVSSEIAISSMQGMLPKRERAASYLCEQALVAKGVNWFEAQRKCRTSKTEEVKDQRVFNGDYAVAEKVLEGVEESHKKLLLHLLGDISVSGKGKKIEIQPPRHRELIALLHSGKEMKDVLLKDIGAEKPEREKILELLTSIQGKLLSDETFDAAEKALLDSSSIPISSLITLMTQYKGSGSKLALERYADLLAFERVIRFSEDAARCVLHKAEGLRAVQINGYELDEYIKQVQFVLHDLQVMKDDHHKKIEVEQQAFETMIKIDQHLRETQRGIG